MIWFGCSLFKKAVACVGEIQSSKLTGTLPPLYPARSFGPQTPKPEEAAAGGRAAAVAVGCAQVAALVIPSAAADHPMGRPGAFHIPTISATNTTFTVPHRVIPVHRPLKHASRKVLMPPSSLATRVPSNVDERRSVAVRGVRQSLVYRRIGGSPGIETVFTSSRGRVLPLRFGWKSAAVP